jgi:hypothetical protein
MKKKPPIEEPYYGTARGLDIELNLPRESWMQDWPIEVVKKEHLPMLLEHYIKVNEVDKKYVLMLAMLEIFKSYLPENIANFSASAEQIKQFLMADYTVHEYHIYSWLKNRYEHYEADKSHPLHQFSENIKDIYEKYDKQNRRKKRRNTRLE